MSDSYDGDYTNVTVNMSNGKPSDTPFLSAGDAGACTSWKRSCSRTFATMTGTQKAGLAVMALVVTGIFAAAIYTATKIPGSDSVKPWENLRLPTDIRPDHYYMQVQPDLNEFTFKGHVDIDLTVVKSTDLIILHSLDLELTNYYIKDAEGAVIKPLSAFVHEENQFFVMTFDEYLTQDAKYTLHINFEGKLTDYLGGFYRSSYKNDQGETVWLATTQFEATDARRAFPCFDEPAFKATFTISIICDETKTAISNMPITETTPLGNGLKQVDFDKSVKMSTYLLAYIVCDFVFIEKKTDRGVTVRVWAPKEKIGQADLALDAGVFILNYYEDYFDVPYPLPKQDMVAIPDFAAGAMENWGLITYRETALLYDPKESSESDKQRAVIVIAHELAHQWFGNLVTMDWWSGLWLNEGFASYMEYVGTHAFMDKWEMMPQFLTETQHIALALDSNNFSHPILQPVSDPAEINELFDAISYDKGASLIRMLASFVGDEVFRGGLTRYLKKHAYDNARTEDLWDSLAAVAKEKGVDLDVAEIMNSWTLQMGYPVVNVALDGDKLVVSQERFLITSDDAKNYPQYKWDVDVIVRQGDKVSAKWLRQADESISFDHTANAWAKVNADETGFLRVNYSPELWKLLQQAIANKDAHLSMDDRTGLLDDAFALSDAGRLPVNQALELTQYLKDETAYTVWAVGAKRLSQLAGLMRSREGAAKLAAYGKSIVQPQYARMGWDVDGSHTEILLRATLIRLACRFDVDDCRTRALNLFQEFMADPVNKAISPSLRETVYSTAIAAGGTAEWDFLFARYKDTQVQAEARKCLRALSASTDPATIDKLIEYAVDAKQVRAQDTVNLLVWISENPIGEHKVWKFIQDNYAQIYARYGEGSFQFGTLIKGILSGKQTKEDLEQIQAFFKTNNPGSGKRALDQTIENIKWNIEWLSTNYDAVVDWLNQH